MTEYALIKQDRYHAVGRVERETKRHVWVNYPKLGTVRETKSAASWRFPTCEAASEMRARLNAARDGTPTE